MSLLQVDSAPVKPRLLRRLPLPGLVLDTQGTGRVALLCGSGWAVAAERHAMVTAIHFELQLVVLSFLGGSWQLIKAVKQKNHSVHMVIHIGRGRPQKHSGFLHRQLSPSERWSKHGKISEIKAARVCKRARGSAWAKKKS